MHEEEMEELIKPENMFVTKGLIITLFQNKNRFEGSFNSIPLLIQISEDNRL